MTLSPNERVAIMVHTWRGCEMSEAQKERRRKRKKRRREDWLIGFLLMTARGQSASRLAIGSWREEKKEMKKREREKMMTKKYLINQQTERQRG